MDSGPEPPWRRQPFNQRSSAPNPRKRPADTQEDAWVAGEDKFVLQQAKKKAEIRVKEGRAKPIDWLAVTLRFIDPSRNPFEDEIADSELNVVNPEGVFEGLDTEQLAGLERDIDVYVTLEKNKTNKDFWETMHVICKERLEASRGGGQQGRGVESVSADVEKLFSTKSFDQLEALESQIKAKLRSNDPIDVDYWEQLLRNLISWKARAKLQRVSQAIMESQLHGLRNQQEEEAQKVRKKLDTILQRSGITDVGTAPGLADAEGGRGKWDPEPMLKVRAEDKALQSQGEAVFLEKIVAERRKILKLGFVPVNRQHTDASANEIAKTTNTSGASASRRNDDISQATSALYEREVARGVGENEEVFAGEEDVTEVANPQWSNKYRPRKPRYFNRVQMGYEWNKYNQTHYDHDNPPPKVVQGYKFNIFYPDLLDKVKAPTYKIEREHGRKRGQTFAPAGEEDTCLIRFIAGPPYEDVAFRIVDKEWDYSAKRERGFRSSFDKGILQLHFQFKKIFYRK